MFKISDEYSLLLEKLEFENVELQSQKPFEMTTINEPINLSNYINDTKDFFVYEGKFPFPPCEKNTKIFILTDVLNATQKQIDNFPKLIQNQSRKIQSANNRRIYTTFKMNDFIKLSASLTFLSNYFFKFVGLKRRKNEVFKISCLIVSNINC